jgi:hypothetical protein
MARNMNALLGVFMIAMNNGIGDGLAQRYFYINLGSLLVSKAAAERRNEFHELLYEWRNLFNSARKRLL